MNYWRILALVLKLDLLKRVSHTDWTRGWDKARSSNEQKISIISREVYTIEVKRLYRCIDKELHHPESPTSLRQKAEREKRRSWGVCVHGCEPVHLVSPLSPQPPSYLSLSTFFLLLPSPSSRVILSPSSSVEKTRYGSSSFRHLASGWETQGLGADPTVRFSSPRLKWSFNALFIHTNEMSRCRFAWFVG